MTPYETPDGYELLTITARALRNGDLYMAEGYAFQASDVQYNRPSNRDGDTRTTWMATWLGTGSDPGRGYHTFGSGGNELAHMTVLRAI